MKNQNLLSSPTTATRADADAKSRSARARAAAHQLHSQRDSREVTAKARAAFADRWERMVDPTEVLTPRERTRRAAHARKAYFTRLGYLSGKARRRAA